MFVASQKRKENIAEYLLYMWQVEDMLRANSLDMERIEKTLVEPSGLSDEQKEQLRRWYESLIDMMRREEVVEHGHLQLNRNTLGQLVDLHRRLLADPKESDYHALFYKTLPYIVELRSKAGENKAGEIETCFNFLYGILLMRLQGRQLSSETQSALVEISRFLAVLAQKFHEEENNPPQD